MNSWYYCGIGIIHMFIKDRTIHYHTVIVGVTGSRSYSQQAITDPAVEVADDMDDDNATQTIDTTVDVAAIDNGYASPAIDQPHVNLKSMDDSPTHVPPAVNKYSYSQDYSQPLNVCTYIPESSIPNKT